MLFLTDNKFIRNLTTSVSQFMHQLVQGKPEQQGESSKRDLPSSTESAVSEVDSWGSPSSTEGQEFIPTKHMMVCSTTKWEYDVAILPEIDENCDKENQAFDRAFEECFESTEPDWDVKFDQFLKTYAEKQ